MHAEAMRFAQMTLHPLRKEISKMHVLEIGSRDVNGSIRPWIERYHPFSYTGIDVRPGPGVDVQADGATFGALFAPDLIICMEVLEHAHQAAAIVWNMGRLLNTGGRALITCATAPRAAHSSVDGGPLQANEYYGNVNPEDMRTWIQRAGMEIGEIEVHPRGDLYVLAVKA